MRNTSKKTESRKQKVEKQSHEKGGVKARSRRLRIERPAPVPVMIDHPTLGRVKALRYPAIPGTVICPEHGLRCRNWRRKRCERVMREAIPTDLLLRLMNASPEQFAAVERVLGIKAENGAEVRLPSEGRSPNAARC